ncbi:MAG TPA: iron-containing alcohol dehydrogenase [Planctomycetaceae bacterium]|jgi:alcohol dehydrogenase class IV|nr:iron-containing alcohol dehydrogenase [Planctomycetaceae bacterium]
MNEPTAGVPLRFDFLANPRVVFGWGRRAEVGRLARTLGKRAFLVTGSSALQRQGVIDEIAATIREAGVELVSLAAVSREPEVAHVDAAVDTLLAHEPRSGDLIVAIGGGSAIDLAKAVAAMATNRQGGSLADFLEGVGKGLKVELPPLPVLAMPTTSGTGSEATKNAVISCTKPPYKKSLRSELMIPRAVLIDPELTVGLPPEVTAHTGMDAITQLIESYLSRRAQPIPQALALDGLARALPAIETAVSDGSNPPAREAMAYAAYLSGVALANSGLGLAHGVAAALGIRCGVAHGLACAVMLPTALRVNKDVRRTEIARLWTLVDEHSRLAEADAAEKFIQHITGIARNIGIPPRLSALGVEQFAIPALVKSSRGNSMDGNPRNVSDEELRSLLEAML